MGNFRLSLLQELLFGVLCIGVCGVGIVGCGLSPESTTQRSMGYVDVRGLLAEEAGRLGRERILCQKHMYLDTAEIIHEVRQDSTQWMKEFGHLLRLDLNIPAAVNAYDSSRTQAEGLSTLHYYPKATSTGQVQALSLSWDHTGTLVSLQGQLVEDRFLYSQTSHVEAYFTATATRSKLVYYQLRGYQKLLTQDTLYYCIVWTCP